MLPSGSSLCTGAQLEPAQLSYWNAEAPGGTSGFAPQRSTTQSERPSLSTATPFNAPHLRASGSFPHGATVRYGLGRSLVGAASHCHAVAHPAMTRTEQDRNRPHFFMRLLLQKQTRNSATWARYARSPHCPPDS